MSTPGQPKVSVRQLLQDRCLTVASHDDAFAVSRHLDAGCGGIVFSSTRGISKGHTIRNMFPGLVVAEDAREREKEERPATPEVPIAIPDSSGTLLAMLNAEQALEQLIAGQIDKGANIAVVPGRVIRAEDSESLMALLTLSNTLDRDDVILRVPAASPWFRRQNYSQLIDLLSQSRHPVALSPADKGDPMKNKGVPEGFRMVIDALNGRVIPWKTDLAGIDALARGALATAIGVVPTLRHSSPPGGFGQRIDKADNAPRIFVSSLLRYVRVSYMRDEWFASSKPWTCDCSACHGRPIDRFTESPGDKREAAVHNAIAMTALHKELAGKAGEHRRALWHEKLEGARAAHEALSAHINRKVTFDTVLQYWLDHA
jgi:hypothetical protein